MKIKYDNITAKIAKHCAIIFSIILFMGLVMAVLKIPDIEVLYIMAVYMGALVGIPCWGVYLFARMYFIRLRAYGYEIPDNKKKYRNNLSTLVRGQGAGRSLFAWHSRIGMWLYLIFFFIFMAIDLIYLIKWNFIKDISLFMFNTCGILNIVWFVFAMIMKKQGNVDKYRDDVECDRERKERWNLENIIVFAIVYAIVCGVASNFAVSFTKYTFEMQIDRDMVQTDIICKSVISVLHEYETKQEQEAAESYKALCDGVELTAWGKPEDELQCSLAESLQLVDFSELADDFKTADGAAKVYVQYRNGNVIVKLLNPIKKIKKFGRKYREIYVESAMY